MRPNMGSVDRGLRLVLALLVGVMYWQNMISGTVALVLGAFAIVFLLTSLVGTCPAYLPFRIDTRSKAEKRHH